MAGAWKHLLGQWLLWFSGLRSADSFAKNNPGHRGESALGQEKAAIVAPPFWCRSVPESHRVGLDSELLSRSEQVGLWRRVVQGNWLFLPVLQAPAASRPGLRSWRVFDVSTFTLVLVQTAVSRTGVNAGPSSPLVPTFCFMTTV